MLKYISMQKVMKSSRVMSIFTKRNQPIRMMLGKAWPLFCILVARQCSETISMQSLSEIYHVIQGLWAFSRVTHARSSLNKAAFIQKPFTQASGLIMLTYIVIDNVIIIYHVVQEL